MRHEPRTETGYFRAKSAQEKLIEDARGLAAHDDSREVVADPNARCFGALPGERTLVPGDARASPRPVSRTG